MTPEQPHTRDLIAEEGADAILRFRAVGDIAKSRLVDTAVVQERPWNGEDVKKIKSFLLEVAPFAHPKVFPNYWDHLVIASIYAKILAEKTGELNPLEAEVLLLLHDL